MIQSTILQHATLLVFIVAHSLLAFSAAADETSALADRGRTEPAAAQRSLFDFLRVQEAWKKCGDTAGCRVGILDAGFDFFHPCLGGVLEPTFFANGVFHLGSNQLISHGTAMASLVAAQRVDDDGMVGLAPRSKLLAASMGSSRFRRHAMRDWVDSKTQSAAEGLIALIDTGAQVISFSAHFDERTMAPFPEFQARLDTAYAHAAKHDVLVVVAAGNTGTVETVYPGTSETVLVVGASLLSDELWEQEWKQGDRTLRAGSCTGPRLSVVAPVQKLVVAKPHDQASYEFEAGPFGAESGTYAGPYAQIPRGATSQATPIAASLAALIRSNPPRAEHQGGDRRDPGFGRRPGRAGTRRLVRPRTHRLSRRAATRP